MQLREHPEALEELREAAFWYGEKEPILAEKFSAAIAAALRHIQLWPESGPIYPGWDELPTVRTRSFSTFPYHVIYYVANDEIRILAYAHERRKPGYWYQRLHQSNTL